MITGARGGSLTRRRNPKSGLCFSRAVNFSDQPVSSLRNNCVETLTYRALYQEPSSSLHPRSVCCLSLNGADCCTFEEFDVNGDAEGF
jgi:hypothetical protein